MSGETAYRVEPEPRIANLEYFPLPIAVEEITAAWLSAALRQRAPGITVRGFEIMDFIHTTCTKIRLRLDEDLKARGVSFCPAAEPQTFDQVARRMRALARFHAGSWGSAELEPGGKWADLDEFLTVMRPFFEAYTQPEKWQRAVLAPPGAAASVHFHGRGWLQDAWHRMVRFSQQLPYCVLHGDLHLGNLYIDADGGPGFFDGLASRGPGMLEVSYHISASVDVADRRRWERALVQVYLDELARSGVAAPPLDEAMRQYGILLVYGYFIWVSNESHYQPPAVNTANAARTSAAMIDHDINGLLRTA
jgi:aminoglycoside phosphotransferase (APT) family kinase protein